MIRPEAHPRRQGGTALRCTMPASWAHVGAMHVLLDARDLHAVGEYLTIHDLVPVHGRPVVCSINGEYIGRADWWQPVRRGDVVVFAEVAGSGGVGRIIGMIVVAFASAYTGGAAAAAYASAYGVAANSSAALAAGAAAAAGVSVFAAAGGAVLIPRCPDGRRNRCGRGPRNRLRTEHGHSHLDAGQQVTFQPVPMRVPSR